MIDVDNSNLKDWQGEVETLGEWQSQLDGVENMGEWIIFLGAFTSTIAIKIEPRWGCSVTNGSQRRVDTC